ncbi:MAG: diaminopimelate decarboxylase [Calditrichaeota bacterium]|nr:MAG: diaminopimelate decarboxylase [Calditrichota bacterium]
MILRDKNKNLLIEETQISELAKQFGTPIYAYSEKQIRKNIQSLKTSLSKHFEKFQILYAIKANSNPHILRIFQEEGLGADCSCEGEIFIAEKLGFSMKDSIYTANYQLEEDLARASQKGIILNLDDYNQLDELCKISKPEIISFRINPGIGRGGFEGIVTGGTDAKFGFPYEETEKAYRKALDLGIKRFGIHMMTGSNNLEPFYFAEITQKIMTIAGESLSKLGIQLEFVDIGGGFGIPYTENESEIDLDLTFKLTSDAFYEGVKKYSLGNPKLIVEPGRFLVGNAGVLISQVTHVKQTYKRFAGLDAGMSTLLRPSLYEAYHKILIDRKSEQNEKYFLTGQICENSDIHPQEREMPNLEQGDLAVITDVGAYGFVMSSHYNHRPKPAEILVSGKNVKLIRRAETLEDIWQKIEA